MANIQVTVDDALRDEARRVASGIGLDIATAVRMFLVQMVRANGLPFQATADPFYSAKNQAALEEALQRIHEGKFVTKTMAELESMAE